MPYTPIRRGVGRHFDTNLNAMLEELFGAMTITHAEQVAVSSYATAIANAASLQGSTASGVSVSEKAKNLNKFGRNNAVGTSFETVGEYQGTTANETFVSTNLIDSISSDDQLNDVGITLTVEGHTVDGSGNLTFVIQNATLDGTDARTKVALTTPLARATRLYVANSGTFDSPQAVPTGNIYVYDDTDGVTAGVPTTAAATKVMIIAGETQSEKCATSISYQDFWFIETISAAISTATGPTNIVTVRAEIRDVFNGGVWRPIGRDITLHDGLNGRSFKYDPLLIVPPNHDVRLRAKTDAGSSGVYGSIQGYLAIVA